MAGRRPRETTRRQEHGASLVEFALVLPLLTLLLLGTITGGLALSDQNSVKNAVREATRLGAVLDDFTTTSDNLKALYEQVVAGATGDLDVGTDNRVICVALIDNADSWDYRLYGSGSSFSQVEDATLASVPNGCTDGFDPTVATGTPRVWVRASRTSKVDAVLYSADWTIDAQSMTRYEREL